MAATLIYVLFLFPLADFKMHFRGRFAPVGSHCGVKTNVFLEYYANYC